MRSIGLRRCMAGLSVAALSLVSVACGREMLPGESASAGDMKPSIDVYVESDAEFYRQLRPEAALLTRPPATLQEAADQATAVVIASVESVRVQRKIVDVYTAGVHLNVTKVLHGELSPELGTNVVVEFLVSSTEADVAKLGEFVPQAEAIWFLRWQGEPPPAPKPNAPADRVADLTLYSVVHLEAGIYHQGRTGVAAPTRQPGEGAPSGAVAEAERYATMTELAAYIESLS